MIKESSHLNNDMRQNNKTTRQNAISIRLEKSLFVLIWLNEIPFEIQCKIRDVFRLIHGSLHCFIILEGKTNDQIN